MEILVFLSFNFKIQQISTNDIANLRNVYKIIATKFEKLIIVSQTKC